MNILDRYILRTFIQNYLIAFMVLVGLYVALDMVFNFGDMTEVQSAAVAALPTWRILYDIGDYYFYQIFVFFVQLSGMITVVAAAFTLMRLSRFNELTAILASGTPLLRVAAPIVLAGFLLNGLLLIDEEFVIPQMIPKLIRTHEEMHLETRRSYPVWAMQDTHNALLWAANYTPPSPVNTGHIDVLDVIEEDAQHHPTGHLYADAADWVPAQHVWRLTNGHHVHVLQSQEYSSQPPASIDTYQTDITPDEISLWRGGEFVNLLPTYRINELLNSGKSYVGQNALLRTKHMRWTQPLSNLVLLLLAIPTVLTRTPVYLKLAATKCLVLCGLCMGTVFLCYQRAASPPQAHAAQWPAFMAWVPIFIYGPLAVFLLEQVKS